MSWSTVGQLVLVWWNTSLSPPIARTKAQAADLDFVVKQLREIRQQVGFDVLALGEVCSSDLQTIVRGLGDEDLSVHDATDRTNRLMFDTAVIYDRRKVTLESNSSIIDKFGRRNLKTGEALEFRVNVTNEILTLVVSHWPSRMTAAESSSIRAELGTALRKFVERKHEAAVAPYVVLGGDYNDDPCSSSIASHLLATRDRSLARRDARFLYNPFWRKLGESHDIGHVEEAVTFCGTHFYAGGDHTQRFTYDQFIFSSAFLNESSMRLNERFCSVIAPAALRTRLLNRREIFDHLPVLGTIELRSQS